MSTSDYPTTIAEFKHWLNSFMQQPMEDRGPYTEEVVQIEPGQFCYARLDKHGNPVAFYGEHTRQAMIALVKQPKIKWDSDAKVGESAFERDYPPRHTDSGKCVFSVTNPRIQFQDSTEQFYVDKTIK